VREKDKDVMLLCCASVRRWTRMEPWFHLVPGISNPEVRLGNLSHPISLHTRPWTHYSITLPCCFHTHSCGCFYHTSRVSVFPFCAVAVPQVPQVAAAMSLQIDDSGTDSSNDDP
jgi:hypothetical protein